MQAFELLGGKYQQGEQIASGAVDSFRSYQVPSGRPVFLHRIAVGQADVAEMAALLSAGLIHSGTVRKLIVDVYETERYRFVVTEPREPCVPFREWLEREAGEFVESASDAKPVGSPMPHADEREAEKSVEEPAREDLQDSPDAEFARLFHEALSGRIERARRTAPRASALTTAAGERDVAQAEEVADIVALSTPAPAPSAAMPAAAPTPAATPTRVERAQAEPVPISHLLYPPKPKPAPKSNLIVFLVVLGVVAVAIAMFVVLVLKR